MAPLPLPLLLLLARWHGEGTPQVWLLACLLPWLLPVSQGGCLQWQLPRWYQLLIRWLSDTPPCLSAQLLAQFRVRLWLWQWLVEVDLLMLLQWRQ